VADSRPPAPDPDAARPAISVVVPVFNGRDTIALTLTALGAQQLDADYEVIVVDGGSTDGTLEVLAEAAAAGDVTVLHNPEREPASSRNLGARHAGAPALAFTDADCEPEPGWLAAGLRALQTADLVQGTVVPAGDAGPFDRTLWVTSDHGLYLTANLLVTRTAFDRAGGFEPVPGLRLAPGSHFGEDAWFGWRCKRTGARSAFAGDAVVRHAVFPRGRRGYLAEFLRVRYFPALVALVPELRGAFLHRRWFLSPVSMRFDLALAGGLLGLALRRRAPLLAAVPYATALAQQGRPLRDPAGWARVTGPRLIGDVVTFGALAAGSVLRRTPVL
jgi:glycosyltransferase involved in cell wall biosynthesis